MQFELEIVTLRSLPLTVGDYFSTEFQVNHLVIPASRGRDTYDLNIIILPEKRLAGTGRQYTYSARDLACGMGSLQARPSESIDLPWLGELFTLRLETNRLLDYRELPLLLELEMQWVNHSQKQMQRISLYHPELKIDWPERGTFEFNLTTICKNLFINSA